MKAPLHTRLVLLLITNSILLLALCMLHSTQIQAAPADQPIALQRAIGIDVAVETPVIALPAGLTESGLVAITAQLKDAIGADFVPGVDDPKEIYIETTFGTLSKSVIIEGLQDEVNDGQAHVVLSAMVAGEATVTVTYTNADETEISQMVTVTFERPENQGVYEKRFEPGTAIVDWNMPGIGSVNIPPDLYPISAIVKFTNTTQHIADIPDDTHVVGGFVMQLFWSDGYGLILEENVSFGSPIRLKYMADDPYSGRTDVYTALWDAEAETWGASASGSKKGTEPVVSYLSTYGDYAKLAGPGYTAAAPDGIAIEASPTTVQLPVGITNAGVAKITAYLTHDGKPWQALPGLPSQIDFNTTFGKPNAFSRDIMKDGDGTNVALDLEAMVAGEADVRATYTLSGVQELVVTTTVTFKRPPNQGVYELAYTPGMSKTTETLGNFGTAEIPSDIYGTDAILKFTTALSESHITDIPTGTEALGGFVLQLFFADGFSLILEEGITFGSPIKLTYTAEDTEQVACLLTNGDYATLKREDGSIYTALWDVDAEQWVELDPCPIAMPTSLQLTATPATVEMGDSTSTVSTTVTAQLIDENGESWNPSPGAPTEMYFQTTHGIVNPYFAEVDEQGQAHILVEAYTIGNADITATFGEDEAQIQGTATAEFVRNGTRVFEVRYTQGTAPEPLVVEGFGTFTIPADVYEDDAVVRINNLGATSTNALVLDDMPEGLILVNSFLVEFMWSDGSTEAPFLEEAPLDAPIAMQYTVDPSHQDAQLLFFNEEQEAWTDQTFTRKAKVATSFADGKVTATLPAYTFGSYMYGKFVGRDAVRDATADADVVLNSPDVLVDDSSAEIPRVSTTIPAGACVGTVRQRVVRTPSFPLDTFIAGFAIIGDCVPSSSMTVNVGYTAEELTDVGLTADQVGVSALQGGSWVAFARCPTDGEKVACYELPTPTLSATVNELTLYTQSLTEFAITKGSGTSPTPGAEATSVYLPLVLTS